MTICRSRFRIWFMRMDTCEHNCRVRLQQPQTIAVSLCGVAGRACGLVSLEPTKEMGDNRAYVYADFCTYNICSNRRLLDTEI
ncbi:hypothetical protein Q3G72_001605 [Acer saccharum]|nr:hypothetical protein Q3G72_001605 [Acer saccharum]